VGIARAWVDQQQDDSAALEKEEPAGEKKPKAKNEKLTPVGP
jgi:hypothetical protein